jgi:5'-nucleotidase
MMVGRAAAAAYCVVLTLQGCGGAPAARSRGAAAELRAEAKLGVVGLNDVHGRLRALPAFAGFMNNLRRKLPTGGDVVVVDAGDMFQGTLESNLDEGAAMLDAYATIPVAAAALGNHEFDFGPVGHGSARLGADPQGAIKARIASAPFPLLAANLADRRSGRAPPWRGLRGSALATIASVKVGFIGVLTEETKEIVLHDHFADLDVTPMSAAIARESEVLRRAGARVVVALAHAGAACTRFDDETDLSSCDDGEIFGVARKLPPGTVDLIVAGHTHQGVAHRAFGVPVVEAYSYGRAFSRADVTVPSSGPARVDIEPPQWLCRDHAADPATCELSPYEGAAVTRDPRVERGIAKALSRAAARRNAALGVQVTRAITADRNGPSPLGNLFADLLLASVPSADIAVLNGGGLRADLPAGSLTYGALFDASPFDNNLATVRLRVRELTALLERHLERERHGLVSIAGARAQTQCRDGALRVSLETPEGAPLPPDAMTTVVTSDYLATGGDGFFSALADLEQRTQVDAGKPLREALAERLRARGGTLRGDDPELTRPRLLLLAPRPIRCR